MKTIQFHLINNIAYVYSISVTTIGLGMLTAPFIKISWANLTVEEKYNILIKAFEGCKKDLPMPADPAAFKRSIMEAFGFKSWKKFFSNGRNSAMVELQDDGVGIRLYYKEQYYENGKTIFKFMNRDKLPDGYQKRIDVSMWDDGNQFLRKFKLDNK